MAIDKTALITGGSSGMGLEYARQLAARGYSLLLVSNKEDDLAAAALELAADDGRTVHTLCCDLAAPGAAEEVLAWCDGLDIVPDVLINNAGMFFMKYLEPGCLARARAMVALHVGVVTDLCVLFGSRMKERGSGRILNVSSMTARIPAPGIAVYSATKAYLKSFGRSFSYEMKPFGVSVTTVCPAAVDTSLYPLSDKMRRIGRRVGLIQSPEQLCSRALRAMFRGRRTVSPGILNVILPPVISILPPGLIDRLGLAWIYNK